MQYFSVVAVFKCEADLRKVVQDFFFRKRVSLLAPLTDHVRQFSTICKLHYQVQTKVLVSENILKLNDIWMIQGSQKICLLPSGFSFIVSQRSEIDFLYDPELIGLP